MDSEVEPNRTVLVVGAAGFLGGYIVAALRERGWRVLRGVRARGRALAADERECDLQRLPTPESWLPLLAGVDAVVNVAGILREEGGQTFATVHLDAPLALARACVKQGVQCFVQISALGLPEDGEFVASKQRFDEALLELPLRSAILRPSIVYAISGSYGGTSLLRALAAFPGALLLPGDGRWLIQPVAVQDLADLAARALESETSGIYEVGGPERMTLREYQHAWREWLRIPGNRVIFTPVGCVSLLVRFWETIGSGPVGETMWRMLRRGNVTADGAIERLRRDFGIAPRPLQEVLASTPSQVQDRWQAQLYFLAPALRLGIAMLWLISAWVGWTTPASEIEQLADGSVLGAMKPVAVARSAATFDMILGLWLLLGFRLRTAIASMMALVLVYTLVFGIALPTLWLDPLGGLAKNLVVLPALAVLWVLSERR
ncbi:SDR family oxidoreductase [Pseudoxanthomonas sacheonensis]|uniref:SDR family oxidoreductase n=1 Tax=Pseudoxanthomonas sacheonensis TaxID=443615 RepID=UPI0013D1BB08|nr:SDR family oxidoreductase [Pseudoxanthomonas sacheonensis]KAF1706146.1 epimerase [Pseudoxanthomonas sacheonensis]